MAISVSGGADPFTTATLTVTGLSATTAYSVQVTECDGSVSNRPVTSDGSGNISFTWVPQNPGNTTYQVFQTTTSSVAGPVTGLTADG